MGLPSGLQWASCNVGAERPSESGLYFSWGNTEGHAEGSGYSFSQAAYNTTPAAGITEDLSLNQDAARSNLGAPWRMPTADDFTELMDNCTSVWTTLNGVPGRLFTSNVNGNTIFLPAAGYYNGTTLSGRESNGYYWTSKYASETLARRFGFDSSNVQPIGSINRSFGFPVRAVYPLV